MEKKNTLFFCEHVSKRLDVYLADQLPHLTRSRIQNLIRDGHVLVNGIVPAKTGMILESREEIEVIEPEIESSTVSAENIPLNVVFENTEILIINKPAGMVVHPAVGHSSGTLVNAALGHDPDLEGVGGEKRPGVVHRLDKDTSGLIVIAKNDTAHQWMQGQFRERTVKKTYITLVDGHPRTPNGRIEAPIGRDPSHRQKMAVTSESRGRPSVTEYFTRETFPDHTLLEVHLLTGRTHQIRVHMAFIGCPVAGDTVYGRKKVTVPITRQFLHAAKLEIRLPGDQEARVFEARLPDDLQTCLDELRNL